MAPAPAGRTDPWWQRRGPSILVFCGVLGTMALASLLLRPGGHFACKVFQGERFPALLAALRVRFQEARSFHTAATRAGSREQYLVGRGHRPEKAS